MHTKHFLFGLIILGALFTGLPNTAHAADETVSGTLLFIGDVMVTAVDEDKTVPMLLVRGSHKKDEITIEFSDKESSKIVQGGTALGIVGSTAMLNEDLEYVVPRGATQKFTFMVLFSNENLPEDPAASVFMHFGIPDVPAKHTLRYVPKVLFTPAS